MRDYRQFWLAEKETGYLLEETISEVAYFLAYLWAEVFAY